MVDVLERIGVKQIFALIGDSLNPLADAVRHSSIEWIGVRHEEGAALAASGQAKLTGRLAVSAGTTGPGSTHLVAGLYEAARDHAPVLALSGDMPRKMHGVDYFQTTRPDLLFRDVSLYTETIMSPEQAPATSIRRSRRPMRAAASLISHCRKTSSRHGPTAPLPAWTRCDRARSSRRVRRT